MTKVPTILADLVHILIRFIYSLLVVTPLTTASAVDRLFLDVFYSIQ